MTFASGYLDIAARHDEHAELIASGLPQLPVQPLEDSTVLIAVAEAFESEGLPLAARRNTVEGLQLRSAIVVGFLQVAASELNYPRRARHAAMDALGSLTSGEVESLRPEVWQRWWLEVRTELEDQIQAAADG